eukprot:1345916-Lingulodinium_polyedra.AAC.1
MLSAWARPAGGSGKPTGPTHSTSSMESRKRRPPRPTRTKMARASSLVTSISRSRRSAGASVGCGRGPQ